MGNLKLIIVFTVLCNLAYLPVAWSQCGTTPVVEAVRNGDFEAGYLTGVAGGSHTYTAGTDFDFQSDLSYAGNYALGCVPDIQNKYAVARAEPTVLNCPGTNKAYAGPSYINVDFNDHTPALNGEGFALVADYETFSGTVYDQGTDALPAAWRQVVSVYPGQTYYFSAWFANYNLQADNPGYDNPEFNFVVVPMIAGVPQWTLRENLGSALPTSQMNWQQFYQTWASPAGISQVLLLIEVLATASSNTNDVLIDDISFINGCSNIGSLPDAYIPDLGEGFSLCVTNGSATLNSNVAAHVNNKFHWYQGSTDPQTEITIDPNASTFPITTPGTYRVCVENLTSFGPTCSASSTIVVTNTMPPVSIIDQNICTATTVTLTALNSSGATYTGTGLSYAWTRPADAPASVNSPTYTTGITGSYSVSVTPGAGATAAGCLPVVSNTATVTTNLVTPSFVSLNCSGDPNSFTLTSTTGAANTYGWYTAATGGNLKSKGKPGTLSFTDAQLPATVYLENYTSTEVAPNRRLVNGHNNNSEVESQTIFSSLKTFTIQSVWVRSTSGTGVLTLNLVKDGVGGAASATFNVAAINVWYEVPLNWLITAGSNYIMNMFPGTLRLSVQTGFAATTYGGLATIYQNSGGTNGSAFEWTVRTGSTCIRSPYVLDCSLPVTYISFEAKKRGNQVNLNWATATEQDAKLFIVERSLNGTDYSPIGEVKASNNADGSSYKFVDENPEQANAYYRLRQVDLNGSMDVSEARFIASSLEGTLSILPNPAEDVIRVVLKSTFNNESGDASIHISNVLAQELYSNIISADELSSGVSLDLSSLKPGVYIIKVISTQGEWMEKLIKE